MNSFRAIFIKATILLGMILLVVNEVFSQEDVERAFNLKVEICKSDGRDCDFLLNPIKLIIDRSDTIELEHKNFCSFEVGLKENFNFHRPKYARLLITEVNPDGTAKRQIHSPNFLIDTAEITISWNLNSAIMLVDGGRENQVLQLFHSADIALSDDLKSNLSSIKNNTIDSLKAKKVRNDLKLVQEYNKEYTSYVKLLTLLRPSLIDLSVDIEQAISSLDSNSFSSNEVEILSKRFDAYIKEMEFKNDKSNFPEIPAIVYNDGESLNALKAKYEYILLDVWATWCGPCLQQHPTLNSFSLKYSDSEVFTVVGIAISSSKDRWLDYLMKGIINYPNYYLNEEASDAFINSVGIIELPRYALLRTKDSKLIERNIDFKNIEDILKKYKLIN